MHNQSWSAILRCPNTGWGDIHRQTIIFFIIQQPEFLAYVTLNKPEILHVFSEASDLVRNVSQWHSFIHIRLSQMWKVKGVINYEQTKNFPGITLLLFFSWTSLMISSSSSSSYSSQAGPETYTSDALQPRGLLCNPGSPLNFSRSRFCYQVPPNGCTTRETSSSERRNSMGENCPAILPKCRLPRYI